MRVKSNEISKKPTWDEMPVDQKARWLCLLQAVNTSAEFAEKRGVNIDKSYKWIKPSAFNAYISETFPSMELRLQQEADGIIFND